MKGLIRVVGVLILAVALLGAFSLLYSTAKGYTTWYFRVNGQVTVDGNKTAGYMHANTQRTVLLVTRTDGPRKETYLVPLGKARTIFDCGDWHPLRFFPIAMGDSGPGCSPLTEPVKVGDVPIDKSLVREPRSVEFSTASGRKVKAEW